MNAFLVTYALCLKCCVVPMLVSFLCFQQLPEDMPNMSCEIPHFKALKWKFYVGKSWEKF